MATQIIHWNVRSLFLNLDNINELLHNLNPMLLRVQELHLNSTHKLLRYAIYRGDRTDALSSSDGEAIIVDKDIACQDLKQKTPLEVAAM